MPPPVSKNTYAEVWEMLDGKYAERVRVTDATVVGDAEIIRRWPEIGQGYLSKCMTALSLFTDAKNGSPQTWVRDPVCGREVFPGIYRLVTVDVDVQKPGLKGVIQTLRKGWAQEADWTEARLEESERGPSNDVAQTGVVAASDNPVKLLKIKFPNCDPSKVEAIATSLAATPTQSSVTIQGASYTGTWNTVWAASKLEDDGSGTVTLYLALAQYNIKGIDDFGTEREQDIFYVYDCPKTTAQDVIDAWKTAYPVGSSATTNYSRSNGFVDLVLRRVAATEQEFDFGEVGEDCRYTETQTSIYGTDDEKAYPIPTVTADKGISYSRSVSRVAGGRFNITLTKREAKYRHVSAFDVEKNYHYSTTEEQHLGATDDDSISAITQESGKIKRRDVTVRDDCSKDVVDRVQTVNAVDTGWISFTDRNGTSYYRAWKNQNAAFVDAVKAAFTNDTQNTLSATINEAQLYDGHATRNAVGPSGGGLYTPPDDQEIDYTINVNGDYFDISIIVTSSQATAKAKISGIQLTGSGVAPGIRYLGHGMWKATSVTAGTSPV